MSNKLPIIKQFKAEAKLLSKDIKLSYNASLEKLANKYGFKNYPSIRSKLKPKYKSVITCGEDFYIDGECNIMELKIYIGEFEKKEFAMADSEFLRVKFINDTYLNKLGYSVSLLNSEIAFIDSDEHNEYIFLKKKYINECVLEQYHLEKRDFTLKDMAKYFDGTGKYALESLSHGYIEI